VEQQHQLMMEDNRGKRRTKKVDGGDADEAEEQQTKKKGWLRNLLDLKKELLLNESLVVPRFS
jgi:hypothetical protein